MNYHTLEGETIDCRFAGRQVLNGIYIKLETGCVTGLMGRNGSGKSTLLNILSGALHSESGSVRWNGRYVKQAFLINGLLKYMPQEPSIPPYLSFAKLAGLFGLAEDKLEMARSSGEVSKFMHTRFADLSTGSRKLLEATLYLLADTHFVLLDEPFSYLSPIQAENLSQLIREVAVNRGIMITDHQYNRVWKVSDQRLALHDGGLIRLTSLDDLQKIHYLPQQ